MTLTYSDREKDIMDKLDSLAHAWNWAKQNTAIPHALIDQHILNMRHALNRGLKIIPVVASDTLGTLTTMDQKDNLQLFDFGRDIANRNKDFTVMSSSFSMAKDFVTRNTHHGDPYVPFLSKSDMHMNSKGGEVYEMMIDDEAATTRNRRFYVTSVLPTWDKTLIRFP